MAEQHRCRLAALLCLGLALAGCQGGPRLAPAPDTDAPVTGSNPNKTRPYVVFGKRYVPLTSASGYRERGVASWYGSEFDGRPTANGETFDMHQLTAAHKTLPLPTYVEVTNLRNGKSVVVRVNDRGPFVDNRLIDLSFAAARKLDMVGPGTSLVDIRALDTEPVDAAARPVVASTTQPAPAPPVPEPVAPAPGAPAQPAVGAATPAPSPAPPPFVQVGAYAESANAFRVASALEQGGLGKVLVQEIVRNGSTLYRVRVGPVRSVADLDGLLRQLSAMGYPEARLALD